MIDIEKLSASVPKSENEYIGSDGLIRCQECGKVVETIIDVPLWGKRKVRCICECMKKEMDAAAEQAKKRKMTGTERYALAVQPLCLAHSRGPK